MRPSSGGKITCLGISDTLPFLPALALSSYSPENANSSAHRAAIWWWGKKRRQNRTQLRNINWRRNELLSFNVNPRAVTRVWESALIKSIMGSMEPKSTRLASARPPPLNLEAHHNHPNGIGCAWCSPQFGSMPEDGTGSSGFQGQVCLFVCLLLLL